MATLCTSNSTCSLPPVAVEFPADFLFGVATSATQIEGGELHHSWSRWCDLGRIRDRSHCRVANDHWNRIDEDIERIRALGCSTYRFSVEWARVEPQEGQFDEVAFARYRYETQRLVEAGIKPLLTLHHFTNPLWFEDSGGWVSRSSVPRFLRFVEWVVDRLGDLVSDWVIINEPNVYVFQGYFEATWPPGNRSFLRYLRAARNLTRAHRRAYVYIHRSLDTCAVGSAIHFRHFAPATQSLADRTVTRVLEYLFQGMFIRGIVRHSDYIGVNYYSGETLSFAPNLERFFARQVPQPTRPTTDLGWEVHPEGLGALLRSLSRQFGAAIWVTENGVADVDDRMRSRFIFDHLREVRGAMDSGARVERYYYWTLMDNFEWLEGQAAKFGLYAVDFLTQKRSLRESGAFFSAICRERAVTADTVHRFAHLLEPAAAYGR